MRHSQTRRDFILRFLLGSATFIGIPGCNPGPPIVTGDHPDVRLLQPPSGSERAVTLLLDKLQKPFVLPHAVSFGMSTPDPATDCRYDPESFQCLDPLDRHRVATAHIDKLVDQEYSLRSSVASELSKSRKMDPESSALPNLSNVSRAIYVLIKNHEIDPIPSSVEITQIQPTIFTEDQTDSPTFKVVIDIILETFGMALVRADVMYNFFENEPQLMSRVDELMRQISTHNWSDVAELFDRIVVFVTSAEFLARLKTYLNRSIGANYAQRAMRQMAKNLVIRLVPFAGWTYLIFSFVVAVRKNYDRFLSSSVAFREHVEQMRLLEGGSEAASEALFRELGLE